jgi:hypothetical protein
MDFAALRFASSKDYGTNKEKAHRPKVQSLFGTFGHLYSGHLRD